MYRVKVGENLFSEASAPSKKAARQLAAEEAVKELMADGRLQLNKVRSGVTAVVHLREQRLSLHISKMNSGIQLITQANLYCHTFLLCLLSALQISLSLHVLHFLLSSLSCPWALPVIVMAVGLGLHVLLCPP